MNVPDKELTNKELYKLLLDSQNKQTEKITAEFKNTNLELQKKIENNEKELQFLKKQCLSSERRRRRNNIIVFGLNPPEANLIEYTIRNLQTLLKIEFSLSDINNIYVIGKTEGKKGILIEFVTYLKKQTIFKHTTNLKGSKVAIINDLCPQDQKQQQILVKHLKEAIKNNKQAKIKGRRLEIEGKLYSAEELEEGNNSGNEFYSDIEEDSENKEQSSEEEEKGGPSIRKEIRGTNKNKLKKLNKNRPSPRNTRQTKQK